MLHITNGDSAANGIRAAELGGDVLPWRDVLHEGPVPGGLAADELRELRARWIASQGWGDLEEVRASLVERETALESLSTHDEVILWFEHDLYDQLQLIQVLDSLGQAPPARKLTLLCIDAFPGVEPFIGLGQLAPGQLASLFPKRTLVTDEQLRIGREAWRAFRSADPRHVEAFLALGSEALPFLGAALRRHLAQFPSVRNGLSRTEELVLDALAAGEQSAAELFADHRTREPVPFLGDATFYATLRRLAAPPAPLIEIDAARGAGFPAARVSLTEKGESVRVGDQDAVRLRGIDRWLGGVHLLGREAAWRFDAEAGGLVARRGTR